MVYINPRSWGLPWIDMPQILKWLFTKNSQKFAWFDKKCKFLRGSSTHYSNRMCSLWTYEWGKTVKCYLQGYTDRPES